MASKHLKYLFGGAALPLLFAGYTNIANLALRLTTPTPSEFAKGYGFNYTPAVRARLEEFSEAHVVEYGSGNEYLFCAANPHVCFSSNISGQPLTLTPSNWDKLLGTRVTIFSQPYTNNFHEEHIQEAVGKTALRSASKSEIAFTYVLAHEVGHVASYKHLGPIKYNQSLGPIMEYSGDMFAKEILDREYGEKGNEYVLNLRALTQIHPTHDVFLPLSRERASTVSEETALRMADIESGHIFAAVFNKCVQPPANANKMTEVMVDKLYECFTQNPVKLDQIKTQTDLHMAERQIGYMQAYEYFFGR
jgi:hypothetical protein